MEIKYKKLTINDIKILTRNQQIIEKIEAKFGSLDNFSDIIGMSRITVNQYLKQNKDYTSKFKGNLSKHLGDYNNLFKTDIQQVREYVEIITRDIYSYVEEPDIEVLEYIQSLSKNYDLIKCLAKSQRNIGMYYFNRGFYSFGLRFYNMANDTAEQTQDIDIMCLVASEMIALLTHMSDYRKAERLILKFPARQDFEKATPERKFWFYYYSAVLYISEFDYQCAKGALTRAGFFATTNYTKLKVFSLLGVCHKKEKDYTNALIYYKQAFELAEHDGDKAKCYNNMANLYFDMRNKELAAENIDSAVKLINANDVINYIEIYNTYVIIKDSREAVLKLLDVLEQLTRNYYAPYVLESLSIAIEKSTDKKRIQKILLNQVTLNIDNIKLTEQLYKLLGMLFYRMEVN